MADKTPNQRLFPRAREQVPVRLRIDDGERQFEAQIPSVDISLTGIFLATEFYLRAGTELDLEFTLPTDDRPIRVTGAIVREVRLDESKPKLGKVLQAGFAIRFTEYHGDAKTVLATAFLKADLDAFIKDYLARRSKKQKNEVDQIRDVLLAWEVGKMALTDGEKKLVRSEIALDASGRLRRR